MAQCRQSILRRLRLVMKHLSTCVMTAAMRLERVECVIWFEETRALAQEAWARFGFGQGVELESAEKCHVLVAVSYVGFRFKSDMHTCRGSPVRKHGRRSRRMPGKWWSAVVAVPTIPGGWKRRGNTSSEDGDGGRICLP